MRILYPDSVHGEPFFFFGRKLSSLGSDHVRNIATLSHLRVRDVIWVQGDILLDFLNEASSNRLEWFEICKLPKFVNALRNTWHNLRPFNELYDKLNIFDHLLNCKGTQKLEMRRVVAKGICLVGMSQFLIGHCTPKQE